MASQRIKDKVKKPSRRKTCACCEEIKTVSSFYSSKNPSDPDGLTRWCKSCIFKYSITNVGEIDINGFKTVLKEIDKPFLRDILDASQSEVYRKHPEYSVEDVKHHGKEVLGCYFKNLNSIGKNTTKTYADSEANMFYSSPLARRKEVLKDEELNELVKGTKKEEFKLTEEIVKLFGEGFKPDEYRRMYQKYLQLKDDYSIQTSLHQEALATYVRFKVKEEIATAKGAVADASKWYQAALNAANEGNLTPKRISQEDLYGGVSNFSDIFKVVEQAVDIIPILPSFKFSPHDAIDFNIWCYINYARDLMGQEPCEYADVYKFYDDKKKQYIEQYGDPNHIFDDDTTEDNRERIEQFIVLPDDYKE